MSRIVWQGGQLLHGLWGHAERAVLRGKPPPPPTGAARSSGQSTVRNAHQLHHASHGAKNSRQAYAQHERNVPDSLVQSLKYLTQDALTAVFKSIKTPVDSTGASMVRGMLQPVRRAGHSRSSHTSFGSFARPAGRPSARVPNATVPVPRSTSQVGLQLSRNFSGGTGFEYFITNAPLALRLAADQIDDDLRKKCRVSNEKPARRSAVPSTSARRSSAVTHKLQMQEIARNYGKAYMQSHGTVSTQTESSYSASEADAEVECRAVHSARSSDEAASVSDYDYYFPPSLPPPEPEITTHLTIPLCPDLSSILSEPVAERDFRDQRSMKDFLRDCYNVTEQYDRHRLKRILTIERAFDQEPLRAYRPASWHDDMLVGYLQNDQPFPDVCLTVAFPDCTAEQVTQMLMATLSRESAMWFSRFLTETTSHAAASDGESDMVDIGIADPPSRSPSSISSSLTDIGREVDDMGAASLLSMEEYGVTASWLALDRSAFQHSPLLDHSLQFPHVRMPDADSDDGWGDQSSW